MKIFIDSANISEIKKWVDCGVADGVTTNPSIMFKDGVYNVEKGAKEIANLINPRPLSVEVTTNDLKEMVEQARVFASWSTNIVIKIPIINQDGLPCLEVIKNLTREGIKVNTTVIMSLSQVVLAAKAGATYVSIFAGRIGDEGGEAMKIIKSAREWLDLWQYKTEIIVGSIRTILDIQDAIIAGAHIITIPPDLITKMCDHKYSRDTVRQFINDAKKSLEKMK